MSASWTVRRGPWHASLSVELVILPRGLEPALPLPYKNIHGYLRQIFDAFGPHRCFWGTDITRMPCSYRQCVTMFTDELPWLQGSDKELVMGRAVCEWLGWKHPALA